MAVNNNSSPLQYLQHPKVDEQFTTNSNHHHNNDPTGIPSEVINTILTYFITYQAYLQPESTLDPLTT
ncbi:hypothetical protein HJC23_012567 [Cyclotella cryptica]|uniref:Uncharacterized protein n=1 Tax=Cyclotella cryptica TaxID=29204 RepID=A0ABD3QQ59_9STRA